MWDGKKAMHGARGLRFGSYPSPTVSKLNVLFKHIKGIKVAKEKHKGWRYNCQLAKNKFICDNLMHKCLGC